MEMSLHLIHSILISTIRFVCFFYHPLSFAHIKLKRVKQRNQNMRGVKSNIIENEVNKMKMLPFGLESKFIFYALMFAAQNTEG